MQDSWRLNPVQWAKKIVEIENDLKDMVAEQNKTGKIDVKEFSRAILEMERSMKAYNKLKSLCEDEAFIFVLEDELKKAEDLIGGLEPDGFIHNLRENFDIALKCGHMKAVEFDDEDLVVPGNYKCDVCNEVTTFFGIDEKGCRKIV